MGMETLGPKTVLVVEDDDATQIWQATVLQREGYAVVSAANGREALDCLRQGPVPDLVMLDMLMPVLDGWHFLEQLRQTGPAASVPVLITTATILTRE